MTMICSEARSWSTRRWVGATAIIVAVQLGFIFWLGDRQAIRPRKTSPAPAFSLIGGTHSEWLALTDPSLFALPHARVFSGPAWLETEPRLSPLFAWTESPRWLGLPVQILGASFAQLVAADTSLEWQIAEVPESRPLVPEINQFPLLSSSTLRLEGGLSQRRLLSVPQLPAWPPRVLNPNDTDMLANTVLQVLVDAAGLPVSLTLLGSSGHPPADDLAMSLAIGFQFEKPKMDDLVLSSSNPSRLSGLSLGQLVFEWQTLGSTNTPAAPL